MAIFIGIVVFLVAVAGGVAIYGGRVKPVRHNVEQVLKDDRFPH